MAQADDAQARKLIEELAAKSKPEDLPKVDAQFGRKLDELVKSKKAPGDMIDKLRELWLMLKAPDEVVSLKAKGLIMAAITYFVSPVDLIPDMLGGAGYLDDAQVVRIVYNRVDDDREKFAAWQSAK